jgi:hypothetical protein
MSSFFPSQLERIAAAAKYSFSLLFLRFRPISTIYSPEEEYMNKKTKPFILLAAMIMIASGVPAQVLPVKLCCVAGEYKGSHVNNQLPNCPVPQSETFSMTLKQGIGCSANVWGTIVSPSGEINNFTGTLTSGPRGCCVLTAKFGTRGHVTTFTGTFCLRLGKWQAKGTYTEINNSDPCKKGGTWAIKQI